ncbi:MAG: hypothetical protein ACRYGM_08940 [Janthinobacterium lividum]
MVTSDAAVSIFLQPGWTLVGLVALLCAVITAALWFALFRWPGVAPARTPQAAYHVSATALFALFLSFTASDAWRRSDAAYAALLREASELSTLAQVADRMAEGRERGVAADALRGVLRDYLALTLREEWGRRNVTGSDSASLALDRGRGLALAGLAGPDAALWRVAYERIEGANQARTARLVAGGVYGDALRWAGLFLLFTVGSGAIGLAHLDRPRAAVPAMATYAAAACVALCVVALNEHPYAGWDATTPDWLEQLLARLG